MSVIEAWVAPGARQGLERRQVDLGPIGDEEVEVEVEHCGLCHSDLSMLNDDWGMTRYPAVLGHEVIGRVAAVGPAAKGIRAGQRVGVGWNAGSCMHCRQCKSGDQHLCAEAQPTIVDHHGGFASRVRAHWAWVVPIPDGLPAADAGPLLCGGITVFNPLARYARPTSRVGVVGIGGLGHMGLKFAAAYGCEVTAFTSSERKFEEARGFGAHHVVSTRDPNAIRRRGGSLDLLIVTTNVQLDWAALIETLGPNGRMHVVGAVPEPIPVPVLALIWRQASVSGSPTGSPVAIETMLDFAARHGVSPTTEHLPMSRINEAFERLRAGEARYRIVLDADF
ncbi:NADPH-dependent aldehyde reductase Ahr [Tautonia plasticadhaerens]|uniref:alcohol dehydrogenase (NADP(+)) n=1 Tax=Tautonia plasticadhaerens TaxID=2527974 RepID=A0A518GWB9_9BACT|nr:NAD(P)-dependent alcohol dehydrogenase [Tautonia plasticadhaerens]QDV32887.1 Aldehyde reductase Ahr [Tautonia plasticadhaerens]